MQDANSSTSSHFLELPVDLIDPNPWQPRLDFDPKGLEDLAASVRQDGILQPLIVAKHPLDAARYFVIAGERRLRAAKLAGLSDVPVSLQASSMEADDHLRVALIENIQRSDLNIIEEAKAYRCLIEQFGYSQEDCAQKVGKDRTTIANALRILVLPDEVHQDVISGRISAGHARALAGLNDRTKILRARDFVIKKSLNVRKTETLCKRLKNENRLRPSQTNVDLKYLADTLQSIVQSPVTIKGDMQKGRIELFYFSQEELESLLTLLGFDTTAH